MKETETVTSIHNTRVKRVIALQQKSAERRASGLFVVEGRRELEHCMSAGFEVDSVFFCPEIDSRVEELVGRMASDCQKVIVTPAVYERMAYRGSTEGAIALVKWRERRAGKVSASVSGRAGGEAGQPRRHTAFGRCREGRWRDSLRRPYRPVQPKPDTQFHWRGVHRSHGGDHIGGVYRLPSRALLQHSYCAAPGLQPVLRHRHARPHSHCHGNRVDRTYGAMAGSGNGPHTHTDVRALGLAQRVCLGRNFAVRGGAPAHVGLTYD